MDVVDLIDLPMEKHSGLLGDAARAAWRYARRPLLGAERAAVGAERRVGQMSAQAEKNIANEVTRSGMSRQTHNALLTKWMGNAKDGVAGATYNPAIVGAVGGGLYGGYGGYQDAMQSGDLWDIARGAGKGAVVGGAVGYGGGAALKALTKGGKTHQELYRGYQKAAPNSVTSKIAPKPELMTTMQQFEQGVGKFKDTGKFVGSRAEKIQAQKIRDLEASFAGFGKDKQTLFNLEQQIQKAKSGVEGSGNLDQLLAQRSEILSTHGKGLLGQKAKYVGERSKSILGERGQFNTLGERLRFGKTTGLGGFAGRGLETVTARASQGGLLGKGGLIRGGIALDPRIKMNYDMARYAASQGQYGKALGYGANAATGAGVQGLKFTMMGGMPAYGMYEAATADDPTQSTGRRMAGALGRGALGTALFPLGAMTYAASFAPGMEAYSVGEQLGRGLESAYDYASGTKPVDPNSIRYGRGRRGRVDSRLAYNQQAQAGGQRVYGTQKGSAAQEMWGMAGVNPNYRYGYTRPVPNVTT